MTESLHDAAIEMVVEAALHEPSELAVVQVVAGSELTVREKLEVIDEVAGSPEVDFDPHEARLIKREFVLMALAQNAHRKQTARYRAYGIR